jgi:FkbM family methyltransferase
MEEVKQNGLQSAIFFEGTIEENGIAHILREIYLDRVYSFLDGKKDLTIVDVGANLGMTCMYFSRFAKQIYALEPSSEHFTNLLKNIEYNGLSNVKAINKAIFTESGKMPFGGPPQNKTMRSLHVATWPDGKPIETVDVITLPMLFEDEKIDHVDLLKVDIEGNEVELFSSRSFSEVASKIDMILTEMHAWSGRNNNQLLESLRENGFEANIVPNQAELVFAKRK